MPNKDAFALKLGPNKDPRDQKSPIKAPPFADIHLRLLATSDLHVHLLPFDYYTGTPTDRFGLARTASLIATARAEVENCLLFDNGDFLQGSPLGDYIVQSWGRYAGNIHPMLAAMNHLGYDAGTLGNHEFNYGLDFLTAAIARASFPIVSANVRLSNAQPLVPPYVILDRTIRDSQGRQHTIKIGVIGFTPPQILLWDRKHLAGHLTTTDIVDAAITSLPQMQRDGADIIIALSHSGIGATDATPGMENASTALAQLDGIDAVVTGHSHLVFPSGDFISTNAVDAARGTLWGKPAVMSGFYGSHLGVIDLILQRKDGQYTVQDHRAQARPIWHRASATKGTALVASDTSLTSLLSAVHHETLNWADKPIGHSDIPLHSFFALVTDAPALQLVANAQAQHVKMALSTTAFADLPVLASVAPFKAGGRGGPENYTDVPAGDVMLRHAADLYIHPNTIAALRMTGAEIADWLEYAVCIFNHIPPGSVDAPLINPDFPSFNFDVIFGLDFQIDLGQPPRCHLRGDIINPQSRRISKLSYQGLPIDPKQSFAVATNSYRIATNAGFLAKADEHVLFQSPTTNLDSVLDHFATRSQLPRTTSRSFTAMPGTSVTFDTSPKALTHVAELGDLSVEPIGPTLSGFLRFRLRL